MYRNKILLFCKTKAKIISHSLSIGILDAASTSETSGSVIVECRATSPSEFVFFAITAVRALVGGLVGSGDNLSWQCQVASQVLDAFISQVAVIVLPRESDTDKSPRGKRLHQAHYFQVGGTLDVRVSGGFGILLDNANALLEEVRENCNSIFLRDEHDELNFTQCWVGWNMLVVFWMPQTRKEVGRCCEL